MKISISGSRRWFGVDPIPSLYAILKNDGSYFDCDPSDYLIGDAEGIDTWATHLLQGFGDFLGCRHLSVYYVGYRARNNKHLSPQTSAVRVTVPDTATVPPFTYRDHYMIDHCDKWLGFWNGDSKGTLAAFEYAKSKDKKAFLYSWSAEDNGFVIHKSHKPLEIVP